MKGSIPEVWWRFIFGGILCTCHFASSSVHNLSQWQAGLTIAAAQAVNVDDYFFHLGCLSLTPPPVASKRAGPPSPSGAAGPGYVVAFVARRGTSRVSGGSRLGSAVEPEESVGNLTTSRRWLSKHADPHSLSGPRSSRDSMPAVGTTVAPSGTSWRYLHRACEDLPIKNRKPPSFPWLMCITIQHITVHT
ncbi:hypothetical protein BX600DRAFT_477209, partial [Xylariales sp. PMI_506]